MIYEYHCKDCDVEFEEHCSMSERATDKVCPYCQGAGKYMVSTPAIGIWIDSDRWVKKRESHMKKEQKNMDNHGSYD